MARDTKSPFMVALLDSLTEGNKYTRSEALALDKCTSCGESATEFRDAKSKKEYILTAWCQTCQDYFFGNP